MSLTKTLATVLGLTISVLLMSNPAVAADLPRMPLKAPPLPPAVYDWTGFYLGANVGVGVSETHATSTLFDFAIDRSATGFTGGVQAGANLQMQSLVLGVEADFGSLRTDRNVLALFGDFTGAHVGSSSNWYGTVRGRLGYTSGPSLFYGTGGAAWVNLTNTIGDEPFLPAAAVHTTASGWTAGAGIETMLGGNWTAKGEYIYIDAGRQNLSDPCRWACRSKTISM
jgi:outer membrane immunogenic protein